MAVPRATRGCGAEQPSGVIASGAGGRYPSDECGLAVLEWFRHRSISTRASSSVVKISALSNSSRSFPLKLSMYPFSQGEPGSMYSVFTPTFPSQARTALAVNSAPLSDRKCPGTPNSTDGRRHQPSQSLQDVIALEMSADIDRQALACVLIDHGEHPKGTPFTRPSLHEVVAPHVVTMLGPQPYPAPVVEPQTPAFWLLRRHFQPLPLPDPLDPLVIDMPAIPPQQSGDTAIAVPPVHTCKLDDPLGQRQFIIPYHGQVPLRRTRLLQDFVGPPLGDPEAIQQHTDRLTPPVRAQKLPDATSCSIALSRARSATSFFSRAFSRPRSLSFFA